MDEGVGLVPGLLGWAALEWPLNRRITVNLAPAALRKEGSGFDLPISLAVLAATRQLPPERLVGLDWRQHLSRPLADVRRDLGLGLAA